MTQHLTANRLWKSLSQDERRAAADHFFRETPRELAASAVAVLAKARNMRPQAARSLTVDAQARILASVLDPGEPLAQGLLVSLHLAERRPLLAAFLDALSMPHENGVLAEEAESTPPPTPEQARKGIAALAAFPRTQVLTYVNTLLLQDPERWKALERAEEWLGA
jgi:hypothetical protein